MAEMETQTYQRLTRPKQETQNVTCSKFTKADVLMSVVAFLLARTAILGGVSPFGAAFFAASYRRERVGLVPLCVTALCVAAGMLSIGLGAMTLKYMPAMLMFFTYRMSLGMNRTSATLQSCAAMGACMLLSGMLFITIMSAPLIEMVAVILESLVCAFMTALFSVITPLADNLSLPGGLRSLRDGLSTEQKICLICTAAIIMAGLHGILQFGSISIVGVLCVYAILLAAYTRGAGVAAALGVAAGLVCGAAGYNVLQAVGVFAFCGFVSGCMRTAGKFCVCAGFIAAGLIMVLFADNSGIGIYSLCAGTAAFLLTPKRIYRHISGSAIGEYRGKQAYVRRVQALLFSRLDGVAESFANLSNTLDSLSLRRGRSYDTDITGLFDDAAERVCNTCGVRVHCWGKGKANTYKALQKLPEKLEKKGYIDVLDVPEYFRKRCVRIESLTDAINRLYDVHHINMVWSAEVEQTRSLLSQQYMGFAGVLDAVKNEVSADVSFESRHEPRITAALKRLHIYPERVSVFETLSGRIEAEILLKSERDAECEGEVVLAVSEVLGQPMRVVDSPSKSGRRKICLEQQLNFSISSGVATLTKKGQLQSGDRYMTMNMPDNRYVMAISDGMGSGGEAALESGIAISLIDQLLRAGFDRAATAKLINSALVIKAGTESFATIDMALINLMNGTAEFVKIGSAASYIKRGASVEKILCTTLPAGIFASVDMEMYTRRLYDEDIVVMMSDGVADAADGEDWVCEYLEGVNSDDPEEIAELLIKEAVISRRGMVDDDMTVVAARVWA